LNRIKNKQELKYLQCWGCAKHPQILYPVLKSCQESQHIFILIIYFHFIPNRELSWLLKQSTARKVQKSFGQLWGLGAALSTL